MGIQVIFIFWFHWSDNEYQESWYYAGARIRGLGVVFCNDWIGDIGDDSQ